MLKAKLDSVRKNKKGFSLVELIIVIAIMVALIAVMAPAFVKYVQKSRDSALATAAESFYSAMQTYYGDPDSAPAGSDGDTLIAKIGVEAKAIDIVFNNGTADFEKAESYDADIATPTMANDAAAIWELAGVDDGKAMGATDYVYTITATKSGSNWSFSMTNNGGVAEGDGE